MTATVLPFLIVLVLMPAVALVVWNQRTQERIFTEHREHLYRELADALYAKHAAVLERQTQYAVTPYACQHSACVASQRIKLTCERIQPMRAQRASTDRSSGPTNVR